MSSVFEEGSVTHATSDKNVNSNAFAERLSAKRLTRSKTFRLDSPTTIEACKELGIRIEDLKQKTLEEFRKPNLDEEIVELRFAYYFKRYSQNVKDVYAKKKQILRARQRQQRSQQQISQQQLSPDFKQRSVETGPASARLPHEARTFYGSLRYNSSSSRLMGSGPLMTTYNKALTYVRKSHNTADTKDLVEIIGSKDQYDAEVLGDEFDGALAQEISRFNKLKRQKQREAKDVFDEEIKRIKLVENLNEREKRKKEREKKQATEQKKAEEERRNRAEDKLDKIRETEKLYNSQKMKEKFRIEKKLEDAKHKFAEEAEERKRQIAEHEEKLARKRKIAEENRVRLKEEEQAKCDQLRMEINEKILHSQEKHTSALSERTTKAKFQIQKIEQSVKRIKAKQEHDIEEHVQQLVEKLVKKEQTYRAFQQQHFKETKKKEEEATEKHRRLHSHQFDLRQQEKSKMTEITERFNKVQENLEHKREQDERAMRIRQEQNRLKMTDKQENYNKQIRQMQYGQQKFMEKQKYNQEKIAWLKNQKEVIQQAKVEVSIQSKIERERIAQGIQQLSKVTSEAATSSNLTEQQRKILKEILKPEDYRTLEDENNMRIQARKEAEARRKSLGAVPNQQW